jgi:hypothetical protein
VHPGTGLASVMFPMNHPNNRVELRDPSGLLLQWTVVLQMTN